MQVRSPAVMPTPLPQKTVQQAMLSEQMETQLCQSKNRSVSHAELGQSPQEVSQNIQVISLGCSCGVKMTIRRLGLDEATMPFDWIRSSSKGIIDWLQNGFTDFFQGPFRRVELAFNNLNMTVYRSFTHAFWHDDIEALDTRHKLWRRVQRFLALDKDEGKSPGRSLLFVRSCVTTSEVLDSERMYELLQQRFEKSGRKVWLLIIIDAQDMAGPILHSTLNRLIFWVQPQCTAPLAFDGDGPGPYEEAVAFGCGAIIHDPEGLMPGGANAHWPNVTSAAEIMNPGGPVRMREMDVGLWCGNVLPKGASEEISFAAFEGYSEREVPSPSPAYLPH